jgi:hypothetical protein
VLIMTVVACVKAMDNRALVYVTIKIYGNAMKQFICNSDSALKTHVIPLLVTAYSNHWTVMMVISVL